MALKFGSNTISTSGNYAKFGTTNLDNVKFASTTVWEKSGGYNIWTGYVYVDIMMQTTASVSISITNNAKIYFTTFYVDKATGTELGEDTSGTIDINVGSTESIQIPIDTYGTYNADDWYVSLQLSSSGLDLSVGYVQSTGSVATIFSVHKIEYI